MNENKAHVSAVFFSHPKSKSYFGHRGFEREGPRNEVAFYETAFEPHVITQSSEEKQRFSTKFSYV